MKEIREDVRENLELAGCKDDRVCDCLNFLENNKECECLKLLEEQRKELLDAVHSKEKQISYLDYLTDKLKENK